jgi:hypothetical protein
VPWFLLAEYLKGAIEKFKASERSLSSPYPSSYPKGEIRSLTEGWAAEYKKHQHRNSSRFLK